ncbi:MAG: NUDIX pyrophosphatase [Candidatus Thermoplasmatota archaeon]
MPEVVTCIIKNIEDKILVLKRSNKVKTYQGLWSGVSGYVEKNETPIQTAYKEIREETNLDKKNLKLIEQEKPIKFKDIYKNSQYLWKIYPFLFQLKSKNFDVKIDWENTQYKWVKPEEITNFETVPKLKEVIKKVL